MSVEETSDPVPPAPGDTPPESPGPDRSARREQAAADALRTFVRDMTVDAATIAPGDMEPIELDLRMRLIPGESWQLDFDPPLAQQLLPQLEDALADRDVYQRGAVYDYRSGSARSPECRPPEPRAVFDGYDAMGVPQWCELTQALLKVADERVDQLYAKPPRLLTLIQSGKEVKKEQLKSFGRSSKTYVVLGQVVAGFLRLPNSQAAPDGDRRLALTCQAVETRGVGNRARLHLNILSGVPGGGDVRDLLADDWEPGAARALRSAERELQRLEKQLGHARQEGVQADINRVMRKVPGILRRLAQDLERGHHQARRRTRHAEERRQGQRPVHKAVDDTQAARPEDIFFDEKRQTLVVCGKHHRAHAFNSAGRHVTSFTLTSGSAAFRVRTNRWRAATPEECQTLKTAVQQT